MTQDNNAQQSATESERLAEVGITTSVVGWLQLLIVIGVLVSAVVFNRVLSNSGDGAPKTVSSDVVPVVSVMRPTPATHRAQIGTTGTVQPRTQINISPQVSGRVVYASPNLIAGGSFKAGEILLRIEADDFNAGLSQAEADLEAAQNALLLEEAEAQTARREWALINPNEAVPDLVARGPQIAQAKANIKNAQARLDNAATTLSRTDVSFPFAGRVLATSVEVGQTLAQNQSYGTVYRDKDLEVRAELRADDMALVAPVVGRDAILTQRGRNTPIMTTVIRTDGQIDSDTQLGAIIAALPRETTLQPGTFVNVTVLGAPVAGAFTLPAAMINSDGSVWKLRGDVLTKVYPTVLGRVDGDVLTKGFDVGQGLAQRVPAGASEGMTVKISTDNGQGG